MNARTINVVAHYEVKLLRRSWLFRIFAGLALFVITVVILGNCSRMFWEYNYIWDYTGVSSLTPYMVTYIYSIAQSVIVIFLAGSFLKRDKKLDTAEVIYVRPMSNADYVFGKVWGITRVFVGLNLIPLAVAALINVIYGSPFNLFYYLFYLFTISLPSLWFVLGLSFTLMCVLKNQAVTFIVMLGIIGTTIFYVKDRLYGVFDFFGLIIPGIFSDETGHPELELFLWQRGVYFLAGIALICLTVSVFNRLPHRPWKTMVIGVASCVLLFVSVGMAAMYVRHFHQVADVRNGYIAAFDEYALAPKATMVANDISVSQQGDGIEAVSRMTLRNDLQSPLDSLVCYLNPTLALSAVEMDGKTVDVRREKQVIVMDRTLQPGDSCRVEMRYAGPLDENVCYADIPEDDFLSQPSPNTFQFRYGKRYIYATPRYTLLTPECLWYPVTISPVYPAMPYDIDREFTRYSLTVTHRPEQMAVSQGVATETDGKTVFSNATPLPCISLAIGNYEKKSLNVDSTDYEIYYFRGHDFFSAHFAGMEDTLPAIIRDLRQTVEVKKDRAYPFRKFALVEAPLPFTGYARSWKGYSEHVMPEMVFVPERGLRTDADFRCDIGRMKKWGMEGQEMEENEAKCKVLRSYIEHTFMVEKSSDTRWTESPEVNQLNFGAMFYAFTGFVSSPDYPIFDVALTTMQNSTDETNRVFFFIPRISDAQRANLYLHDHSFHAALSDRKLKPQVFYEMLRLKSMFLRSYMVADVPVEKFKAFLRTYSEANMFSKSDLTDFSTQFENRFHVDLNSLVHNWYNDGHAPEVRLQNVDVNQVEIDDFTKYRISMKAYNPSDVDGVITVRVDEGGGGMRRGGPPRGGKNDNGEDRMHYYRVPAHSAWEIKFINDDRPGPITVNTSVSRNLPNEFTYHFSKMDTKVTDTVVGIFPVDSSSFVLDPGEIVIDNEDPGFRIIENNSRHFLRDLFKTEEEDKYRNFMPWYQPSKWMAVVNSNAYGQTIHSAYYKRKGTGLHKVEWSTEIPSDNLYEIFVWNPKFDMWRWGRRQSRSDQTQTYTIAYEENTETASVDFRQEENGWVSLGSYYLPAGKVTVTLSDKVTSSFVSADAVMFKKLK